jgi:hypothetical protein
MIAFTAILKSRIAALAFLWSVHAAVLAVVLISNGTFISRKDLAPTIIFSFWVLLLAYTVAYFSWRIAAIAKPATRSAVFLELRIRGVFSAALLIIVTGLLLGFILNDGTIGSFALGSGPRFDEAAVVLASCLVLSFIAYSLTSPSRHFSQTDPETSVPSLDNKPSAATQREIVVAEISTRARNLRKSSQYLLAGIVAMVICAAAFVVFAGQITSLDVSGNKLMALAQADVRFAEEELNRAVAEKRDRQLRSQRAGAKADQRTDATSTDDDALMDQLISQRLEAKRAAWIKANDVLLNVRDKQYDDGRTKDQASNQLLLIQTSVTRFGVVIIIVFLVQILVNLYRYNVRLSAFYSSRSDALRLSEEAISLRDLVTLLSPDSLDFGKAPRTPAEETSSIIGAWAGQLKGSEGATPSSKKNRKGAAHLEAG